MTNIKPGVVMLATLILMFQNPDMPSQVWGDLFAFAGAFGASYMLAAGKRSDAKLFRGPLFRKVQPVITLLGAVAAPYVASIASSHVDISGLGAAPIATVAAVVGAELLAMLKRSV